MPKFNPCLTNWYYTGKEPRLPLSPRVKEHCEGLLRAKRMAEKKGEKSRKGRKGREKKSDQAEGTQISKSINPVSGSNLKIRSRK